MINSEAFERAIVQNRIVLLLLGLSCSSFLLATILIPSLLDKEVKLAFLLIADGLAVAFAGLAKSMGSKEALYEILRNKDKQRISNRLAHEMALEKSMARVNAELELAGEIASLPENQHGRWTEIFNLHGMIAPPIVAPSDDFPVEPEPITVANHSLNLGELEPESVAYLTDWLDSATILAPSAVVGRPGSGKTTAMQYICTRFLHENPDGHLLIGDLHFDPEESNWIEGIPPENQEERFVWFRPKQILNLFRFVKQQLDERIDNRNKRGHPIKLVCDEFVGFMDKLSDNEQKEVSKIIEFIIFQGRKFKVSVTIGLHSAKKGATAIDSNVLGGCDLWLLSNSVADATTKWATDISPKELLEEINTLKPEISDDVGRLLVFHRRNEEPRVVLFPRVDMRQLSVKEPEAEDREMVDWHRASA